MFVIILVLCEYYVGHMTRHIRGGELLVLVKLEFEFFWGSFLEFKFILKFRNKWWESKVQKVKFGNLNS